MDSFELIMTTQDLFYNRCEAEVCPYVLAAADEKLGHCHKRKTPKWDVVEIFFPKTKTKPVLLNTMQSSKKDQNEKKKIYNKISELREILLRVIVVAYISNSKPLPFTINWTIYIAL